MDSHGLHLFILQKAFAPEKPPFSYAYEALVKKKKMFCSTILLVPRFDLEME